MKVRVGKKVIQGKIVLGYSEAAMSVMSVVETPLGVYYGSNEIDQVIESKRGEPFAVLTGDFLYPEKGRGFRFKDKTYSKVEAVEFFKRLGAYLGYDIQG